MIILDHRLKPFATMADVNECNESEWTCFPCKATFDRKQSLKYHHNIYLHHLTGNEPGKRQLTLRSIRFEAVKTLRDDFYKDFFKL